LSYEEIKSRRETSIKEIGPEPIERDEDCRWAEIQCTVVKKFHRVVSTLSVVSRNPVCAEQEYEKDCSSCHMYEGIFPTSGLALLATSIGMLYPYQKTHFPRAKVSKALSINIGRPFR
jgi:hypothetical protein